MEIVELWRYPVKSLQGERLDAAEITAIGILGDRSYGIVDRNTGYVLTARREPKLLFGAARWHDGEVEITGPEGSVLADDDALSAWLERPVELQAAEPDKPGTYETQLNFAHEGDQWFTWAGPEGTFHDSTRTRVSICSLGTIGEWERRRFRFNIIVDGGSETELLGASVRVGSAELEVVKDIDRCIMVTRPQPGGIERDTSVLKTIVKEREGNLGVGALVTSVGAVTVGDALEVL